MKVKGMGRSSDNSEFDEFLNGEARSVPPGVSRLILDRVRDDLEPPVKLVFLKLLLVQSFVGVITMLFCPQFNLSLTNYYELFHLFHRQFGPTICMAICGGIFVGSGAVIGSFLLTKAEVNVVARRALFSYLILAIIFHTGFMLVGVDVYLEASTAWIIGSWATGYLAYHITRSVRLWFSRAVFA